MTALVASQKLFLGAEGVGFAGAYGGGYVMLGGAAHGFYEAANDFGVELVGGAAFQFGKGFFRVARFFVGAFGRDGVVGIGDGDDARARAESGRP